MNKQKSVSVLPASLGPNLLLELAGQTSFEKNAVHERLLRRINADKNTLYCAHDAGQWQTINAEIEIKKLMKNAASQAVMLRFKAGASLPAHAHYTDEECVVLDGEVTIGDTTVKAGDYHFAPRQSKHEQLTSRTGATLFIHGTSLGNPLGMARDYLGGLLPFMAGKKAPITIHEHAGKWINVTQGIEKKSLLQMDGFDSYLLKFNAGTEYKLPQENCEEEWLMLNGELSYGQEIRSRNDYQYVSTGFAERNVIAQKNSLLYVRRATPKN
jgi:quercetin dioxygenase-like cupin family protein